MAFVDFHNIPHYDNLEEALKDVKVNKILLIKRDEDRNYRMDSISTIVDER